MALCGVGGRADREGFGGGPALQVGLDDRVRQAGARERCLGPIRDLEDLTFEQIAYVVHGQRLPAPRDLELPGDPKGVAEPHRIDQHHAVQLTQA